jgi:hypothetical protein
VQPRAAVSKAVLSVVVLATVSPTAQNWKSQEDEKWLLIVLQIRVEEATKLTTIQMERREYILQFVRFVVSVYLGSARLSK